MKFEIIKDNVTKFNTYHSECIPPIKQINEMLRVGYKVKIDNKIVSKTQINNVLKTIQGGI